MARITWIEIEPVLRKHAPMANGRALHWVEWCWQILEQKGLTSYATEAEKALVLMRAVSLLRVQQDYAFIMLEIEPSLDEIGAFAALCTITSCDKDATMQWEQKQMMPTLINNYVEWSPFISHYDPALLSQWGGSENMVLNDLRKTLPPENEEELIYPLYPSCIHRDDGGDSSLLPYYHAYLDEVRVNHLSLWIDDDWSLPMVGKNPKRGVRLHFHATWERIEAYLQPYLCWHTEAELVWYREMWSILEDHGYAAYRFQITEVFGTLIGLAHAYQCFCLLALDRPLSMDPDAELDALVEWDDPEEQEEVRRLRSTLLPELVDLLAKKKPHRHSGRFDHSNDDEGEYFIRRAVRTLPLTDRSLVRHYASESAL